MDKISNIISSEEIIMIDVRYINHNGDWNSISYLSNNFDYKFFEKDIFIDDIILNPLNKNRFFIDPFLSHKTLVFLTDIKLNLINNNLSNNLSAYELDFYLDIEDIKIIDDNKKYLSPHLDNFRDFRGEIIVSLLELNVNIIKHYHGNLFNKHTIVISKNKDKIINLDSIQKVKYAIIMTANAYNIKINTNNGIFKDYKEIYKLI